MDPFFHIVFDLLTKIRHRKAKAAQPVGDIGMVGSQPEGGQLGMILHRGSGQTVHKAQMRAQRGGKLHHRTMKIGLVGAVILQDLKADVAEAVGVALFP